MSQYMILMFLIMAFLMLGVLFIEHELGKKKGDNLNEKKSAKNKPNSMISAINTFK